MTVLPKLPKPKPLSKADLARKAAARDDLRRLALTRMLDWPNGLPPLPAEKIGTGILYGLARDGLATALPADDLGDCRFAITDAGRAWLDGGQ